jgi:hypothetical protein
MANTDALTADIEAVTSALSMMYCSTAYSSGGSAETLCDAAKSHQLSHLDL